MLITHLTGLRDNLHKIDDNGEMTLLIYNKPETRFPLIIFLLTEAVAKTATPQRQEALLNYYHTHYPNGIVSLHDQITTSKDLPSEVLYALARINGFYQAYLWPCHDVHFHTNFAAFANCPFTTVTELEDVVAKIVKKELNNQEGK